VRRSSNTRFNILVVEDSPADTRIIQECFVSCGAQCFLSFAASIEQALQCLEATRFSFVILDIQLGWQNGLELVRAMRSRSSFASVPVVALTGMLDQVRPAYEAGVNAVIIKSKDFSEFSAKITSLVNFWLDVAELPPETRGTWPVTNPGTRATEQWS